MSCSPSSKSTIAQAKFSHDFSCDTYSHLDSWPKVVKSGKLEMYGEIYLHGLSYIYSTPIPKMYGQRL